MWECAINLDDYTPLDETIYSIELYSDEPTIDYKARASLGFPDFKNVITWKALRKGIVAVANMWYYSDTMELVDADNHTKHEVPVGIADGDEGTRDLSNAFDIRNIVTHEAGHWTGLEDIYDSTYSAMTMYGYSSYGEEMKRSLECGDIAGAQVVYEQYRSFE